MPHPLASPTCLSSTAAPSTLARDVSSPPQRHPTTHADHLPSRAVPTPSSMAMRTTWAASMSHKTPTRLASPPAMSRVPRVAPVLCGIDDGADTGDETHFPHDVEGIKDGCAESSAKLQLSILVSIASLSLPWVVVPVQNYTPATALPRRVCLRPDSPKSPRLQQPQPPTARCTLASATVRKAVSSLAICMVTDTWLATRTAPRRSPTLP
jgi:hypothetical protein